MGFDTHGALFTEGSLWLKQNNTEVSSIKTLNNKHKP